MEVLYAIKGFEQESEPQLCLEGTCLEFENLAEKIKHSLQNQKLGEMLKIGNIENGNFELTLINNEDDIQLIKRIDSNRFLMSLDIKLWIKVLELTKPLFSHKGYQFIEFADIDVTLVEDLGIIFRAK